MSEQCKYTNKQLRVIVEERGLRTTVDEVRSVAIQDREVRVLWQKIETSFDKLEELLS